MPIATAPLKSPVCLLEVSSSLYLGVVFDYNSNTAIKFSDVPKVMYAPSKEIDAISGPYGCMARVLR